MASTLLLVGSVSLFQLGWDPAYSTWHNIGYLLLFPFPLWGGAVGLATAAYYYRRRNRCETCHQL